MKTSLPKNLALIAVLSALSIFLALGIWIGKRNAATLPLELRSACAVEMKNIFKAGLGDVYNYEGGEDSTEPASSYIVKYTVVGDELSDPQLETVSAELLDEQADTASQTVAWDLFKELIPPQDRQMLTQFNIFTDGYSNTLAAVDQSQQDASDWMLEVDIADLEDKDALLFTLVHEYAHLLTLNAAQVEPDAGIVADPYDLVLQTEKAVLCPTYFPGNGCSRPDSYIHEFYSRFWADLRKEWDAVDALQYQSDDQLPYYKGLYKFYLSHRSQFVGDYAVTHPAEDIAESFTHFVFSPKPAGNSIREQKLAFFYEYPELAQLRQHILDSVCADD